MPTFDPTPDKPEPFGYKVSWFAIKTSDTALVLEVFGVDEAMQANWASGLAAVYASRESDAWAFISPPVGSWIFVVSRSLPCPAMIEDDDTGQKFEALFSRLMGQFDDVQLFASYRVAGFVAWARALDGKPTRIFAFGDDGAHNFGKQTPEEAQLGFADLTGFSSYDAGEEIFRIAETRESEREMLVAGGLSVEEARVKIRQKGRDPIPNETDVVDLAALWSIDPTQLPDQDHAPGVGLAIRLPWTQ